MVPFELSYTISSQVIMFNAFQLFCNEMLFMIYFFVLFQTVVLSISHIYFLKVNMAGGSSSFVENYREPAYGGQNTTQ